MSIREEIQERAKTADRLGLCAVHQSVLQGWDGTMSLLVRAIDEYMANPNYDTREQLLSYRRRIGEPNQ